VLFTCAISAQETQISNPSKKELKAKKKLEKEAKLQEQFESLYKILLDKSFVLEANFITYKTNRIGVDSKLNFVLVDSSLSMLQIGSGNSVGYNGVGGSTAKGDITSYKLSKNDKRKSFYLSMSINTKDGLFYVTFNISANGNAHVSIVYKTLTLIYDGKIVPLKESNIYKGSTWYS
jgi:hypothetical protein